MRKERKVVYDLSMMVTRDESPKEDLPGRWIPMRSGVELLHVILMYIHSFMKVLVLPKMKESCNDSDAIPQDQKTTSMEI